MFHLSSPSSPNTLTSGLRKTRAFHRGSPRRGRQQVLQWSRSVEDPNEFVLLEAFNDDAAGPHVNSDHFQQAVRTSSAADCNEEDDYLT